MASPLALPTSTPLSLPPHTPANAADSSSSSKAAANASAAGGEESVAQQLGPFIGSRMPAADDEYRNLEKRENKEIAGPQDDKDSTHMSREKPYLEFLSKLYQKWTDAPDVFIQYNKLAYNIRVPKKSNRVPNMLNAIPTLLGRIYTPPSSTTPFDILHPTSGLIRPGSMTLILAPPGHGKTTLLRMLAGRVKIDSKNTTGTLLYNGLTQSQLLERGIYPGRLCSYVGQTDIHFPNMSVDETLTFAAQNSVPDASLLGDPEIAELDKTRASMLMDLIGLTECKDTIIGNDLLRGVSGGQRKRVTVAEMLIGNPRAMMLDEPTTGLDAAVAYQLLLGLRTYSHITKASVVTALLQPSPELYGLFDDLILLKEGHVVYHGKRSEVRKWFRDVAGMELWSEMDEADFIVDFLTDPCRLIRTIKQHHMETGFGPESTQTNSERSNINIPVAEQEEKKQYYDLENNASLAATQTNTPQSDHRRLNSGRFVPQPQNGTLTQRQQEPPHTLIDHRIRGVNEFGLGVPIEDYHPQREEELADLNKKQSIPPHDDESGKADGASSYSDGVSRPPLERNISLPPPPSKCPNLENVVYQTDVLVDRYHKSKYYEQLMQQIESSLAICKQAQAATHFQKPQTSLDQKNVNMNMPDTKLENLDIERGQMSEKQDFPLISMNKQELEKFSMNPSRWSEYTKAQFARAYPRNFMGHFRLNFARQSKLNIRNRTMNAPRLFQAVLMGIIYMTLFGNLSLSPQDSATKFGLLTYVVMYACFANLSEIPVSAEARNVVTKQLDAGFFPSSTYTVSNVILHVPLVLVETLIFGNLMYWYPGLTREAGRYFFFLFVMFITSMAMSVFFRCISYSASNPDVARQLDIPFIITFVVFAGFLDIYYKIPNWLIWCYWISPLSWGVRSNAINEFSADRYLNIVQTDLYPIHPSTISDSGTASGSLDGINYGPNGVPVFSPMFQGDVSLTSFGFFTERIWKWAGVAYLGGFFLLFWLVSGLVLSRISPPITMGTKRNPTITARPMASKEPLPQQQINKVQRGDLDNRDGHHQEPIADSTSRELGGPTAHHSIDVHTDMDNDIDYGTDTDVDTNGNDDIANAVDEPRKKMHGSLADRVRKQKAQIRREMSNANDPDHLPFVEVTLVWRNIIYTVPTDKGDRILLRNLNGFAKPGQLLALMGSSGAGKTTLMDLIAGRKTIGQIEGEVLVNGHPKDPFIFSRLMGYVEQNDIHIGACTVREALEFSAKLRLPVSVSTVTRNKFVEAVMELVGLSNIASRVIGDAAIPGLSPGQLKLVTIGVELAANPSILFLDEPTSGLDAPSAYRVMKAVRRIANTGRTVICTIHQPSAQLFYMFDRLLLLRTGGYQVFFDDIGKRGRKLVAYFESIGADGRTPQLPHQSKEAQENQVENPGQKQVLSTQDQQPSSKASHRGPSGSCFDCLKFNKKSSATNKEAAGANSSSKEMELAHMSPLAVDPSSHAPGSSPVVMTAAQTDHTPPQTTPVEEGRSIDSPYMTRQMSVSKYYDNQSPAVDLRSLQENSGAQAPNKKGIFKMRKGANPANWMLDLLGGTTGEEIKQEKTKEQELSEKLDFAQIYLHSDLARQAQQELEAMSKAKNGPLVLNEKYVNIWTRYWEVQKRSLVTHWRNAPMNTTRMALLLLFGIILGLVYLKITDSINNYAGFRSFLSVVFLGVAFPASTSANSAFPTMYRQRAVYYRERSVGMYGYGIYSTTLTITELPFIFFAILLFIIPFYFMIGLQNDATLFFRFLFITYLMALVYSFLSQTFLAAFPNIIVANIFTGLFLSLFFMFGGLFVSPSNIPNGWKWFYYIDPIPKAFIAAILPQVYCDRTAHSGCLNPPTSLHMPGCPCGVMSLPFSAGDKSAQFAYFYEYTSSTLESDVSQYWHMVGWLFLTLAVLRIINLLALRFINHIKR